MTNVLHAVTMDNSRSLAAVPVLFLHGIGGLSDQWWAVQTAVSSKAPTIAFDLPGHGQSILYPKAGPPIIAARAVLADMDARGIKQAHLVGHSMGGAIACLIALIDCKRVASLTLLAPGGFGVEFNEPVLRKWTAARSAEDIRMILPHFFRSGVVIPDKVISDHLVARGRAGAVETLMAIMDIIDNDGEQGVLPVEDVLSLGVPISVIWGELDAIVPVCQSKQLEGRVDLQVVAELGHSPIEEAPDLVCETILKRLS